MSGPKGGVTLGVDRAGLAAVTKVMIRELHAEIGRLERDAQSFHLQGRPLLAADMKALERRLLQVVVRAHDVLNALGGQP